MKATKDIESVVMSVILLFMFSTHGRYLLVPEERARKLDILYFKNSRMFTTIGKPKPPNTNVRITTNWR
jgi:hypothetical protein